MSISEQIKELRKLANSKEFEPHEPVTYGFYAIIKCNLFKPTYQTCYYDIINRK